MTEFWQLFNISWSDLKYFSIFTFSLYFECIFSNPFWELLICSSMVENNVFWVMMLLQNTVLSCIVRIENGTAYLNLWITKNRVVFLVLELWDGKFKKKKKIQLFPYLRTYARIWCTDWIDFTTVAVFRIFPSMYVGTVLNILWKNGQIHVRSHATGFIICRG